MSVKYFCVNYFRLYYKSSKTNLLNLPPIRDQESPLLTFALPDTRLNKEQFFTIFIHKGFSSSFSNEILPKNGIFVLDLYHKTRILRYTADRLNYRPKYNSSNSFMYSRILID